MCVCVRARLCVCARQSVLDTAYLCSNRFGAGGAWSAPGSSGCSAGVRISHAAPPLLLAAIEVVSLIRGPPHLEYCSCWQVTGAEI